MMYITRSHYKDGEITPETVDTFLEQFNEAHTSLMLGHIFFLSDHYHFVAEDVNHKELTEQQRKVNEKAGELIKRRMDEMLDHLTDLYAGAEEDEDAKTDANEAFVYAYNKSLSYYTEATHDILNKGIFKGSEKNMAMSFYVSVGQEHSFRLRELLSAVSIAEYLKSLGESAPPPFYS